MTPRQLKSTLHAKLQRWYRNQRFWIWLFVGAIALVLGTATPAPTAPTGPASASSITQVPAPTGSSPTTPSPAAPRSVPNQAVPNQAVPNQAVQVQIQPTTPELGDTISVIAQLPVGASQPPTVVMRQKNYPMFAMANNRYRALLPTTPLDAPGAIPIQVSAVGQPQTVQLRDRDFPTQSIWLGEGGGPEGTDHEFDRVDAFKALVTPEKFWNGPFLRPSQAEVSTVYGVQRYYNGEFAKDYYHRGVDYAAATGSPVVAPAAGRIALVGTVAEGFELHGNTVGIDHGQGVESIMLHLSQIDVKEGDMVQAGQRLGAVGSTGAATGPHLHWGLYVNGQSVDPVPWRYKGFE